MAASKYFTKEELSREFMLVDGVLWRKGVSWKSGMYGATLTRPDGPVVVSVGKRGYYQTRFGSRKLYVHTIVFILAYGDLAPDLTVDHINGDRTDNRPENLRSATQKEQGLNKEKHRQGKLPYAHKLCTTDRWRSYVRVEGRCIHLGYYSTELEAHMVAVSYLQNNQAAL